MRALEGAEDVWGEAQLPPEQKATPISGHCQQEAEVCGIRAVLWVSDSHMVGILKVGRAVARVSWNR